MSRAKQSRNEHIQRCTAMHRRVWTHAGLEQPTLVPMSNSLALHQRLVVGPRMYRWPDPTTPLGENRRESNGHVQVAMQVRTLGDDRTVWVTEPRQTGCWYADQEAKMEAYRDAILADAEAVES